MSNDISIELMHKKLKKYIESYSRINPKENKYLLESDIFTYLLINNNSTFSLRINGIIYDIKEKEKYLISASQNDIELFSASSFEIILIKFKEARVGCFYSDYMNDLEENIILLEKKDSEILDIFDNDEFNINLNKYFIDRFKALSISFNIQSIVELVDKNKGLYDIEEVLLIANVPRRIFLKMFTKYMTLSLKTYAKIIRKKYLANNTFL